MGLIKSINELSSRQHQKKGIADIVIGDDKISSAPEMAEAFNNHFANIGHDLVKNYPRLLLNQDIIFVGLK